MVSTVPTVASLIRCPRSVLACRPVDFSHGRGPGNHHLIAVVNSSNPFRRELLPQKNCGKTISRNSHGQVIDDSPARKTGTSTLITNRPLTAPLKMLLINGLSTE